MWYFIHNTMYIYKIQNKINNKLYVGSSRNYKKRWYFHLKDLRKNNHPNIYLQTDYNKYGEDNFEFSLIYEFPEKPSDLVLLKKEKDFINKYPNKLLYNIDLKILGIPNKSLSVKNNRFKPKKSLCYLLLKYKQFEEDYIKMISVDYRIPITTVKRTINNLINSNKLRYYNEIYYRV